MPVRVGIDVVSVTEVREAVDRHAERYVQRVYTDREQGDCRTGGALAPERLAARFAAKEATMKVLRPGDRGLPWREIGVRRHPDGWVDVELDGRAAALAADAGVSDLALSLTHEGDTAAAVVVAELTAPSRGAHD